MYKPKDVDDYIEFHTDWQKELTVLRDILHESELEETIKWNIPTYTWNNKNVIGLGAFNHWTALWFFQGSFLDDPYQILVNAQEGKTQGLRQWRFKNASEIESEKVLSYIQEAIENQRKGLEIKPTRAKKKLFPTPEYLLNHLKNNGLVFEGWRLLTDKQQSDYVEYIDGAKQEKTRLSRIQKCLPLIQSAKGVNKLYS